MTKSKLLVRGLYVIVVLAAAAMTFGISLLLESKQYVYQQQTNEATEVVAHDPFPVSVDPISQTILAEDLVDDFAYETLALKETPRDTWKSKVTAFFANRDWYQNLASPVSRILVIWPGERKEEIVSNIGDILRWNNAQRAEFLQLIATTMPIQSEGKFYPGQYLAHRGALPSDVATLVETKFNNEILSRYTEEVSDQVPLDQALIIASLLEREASDFENMREISGVIWNRLFIDMPLQLDATLQYVRGSRPTEKDWWPVPTPADKYLESPFNTYANEGLPPAPIGNPSAAAVLAALNPRLTDCLYYFHDAEQKYFCSTTYEEHVRKLKISYGQGR